MTEMRERIDGIFERLPFRRLLEERSPLGLTDFGREVGEEIHAKEWAANMVANLKSEVESKSLYQVQEFCFDYVKSKLELMPEQAELVESSAYSHGLKIEKVRDVLVIELRDALIGELRQDS